MLTTHTTIMHGMCVHIIYVTEPAKTWHIYTNYICSENGAFLVTVYDNHILVTSSAFLSIYQDIMTISVT